MESFTASESNLARTQMSSLGESREMSRLQPAILADFPRHGQYSDAWRGCAEQVRVRRVFFIHYCHFNHLGVQLSINHYWYFKLLYPGLCVTQLTGGGELSVARFSVRLNKAVIWVFLR